RAAVERFHEVGDRAEVVREVRVAHDDVRAARGGESSGERGAVAARGDRHDARARRGGELARAVRRAVVRDEDLAPEARAVERRACLRDAAGHGFRLVQAGHHHGNPRRLGGRHVPFSPSPAPPPRGVFWERAMTTGFRVSLVDYVNAWPLTWGFLRGAVEG